MIRAAKKALVGDGNFGGLYQRSDADMLAIWEVAVAETRTLIRGGLGLNGSLAVLAFIIQRLLQALVVMLVISALVFIGVYAVGNPIDVMISPDATQQIREQAIRAYGFDQPLWRQYFTFLERLATGDFGRSFVYNTPVLGLILSRLPATLEITLAAVIGATLLGVPLGMYAGYRPDSVVCRSRSWRSPCSDSRCPRSGSGSC